MQSDKPKDQPTFGLQLERFGPLGLAVVTFAASLYFSSELRGKFGDQGLSTANLYSAVFNWAAIQTGFAFGVYGFVAGKTEGFVSQLKDTVAMRRFVRYVKRANFGCFALAAASLPLVMFDPPLAAGGYTYSAVAVWFSLFIWSFFSFLRVSFGFGQLVGVKDEKPFYGA